MTCPTCNGDGWLQRRVAHHYVKGYMVNVTRVCEFCKGKGHIHIVPIPSGKDKAAQEREDSNV